MALIKAQCTLEGDDTIKVERINHAIRFRTTSLWTIDITVSPEVALAVRDQLLKLYPVEPTVHVLTPAGKKPRRDRKTREEKAQGAALRPLPQKVLNYISREGGWHSVQAIAEALKEQENKVRTAMFLLNNARKVNQSRSDVKSSNGQRIVVWSALREES